jgi:hypothetical protein
MIEYVNTGAIPEKYRSDARHIAIGVIHDLDYIVSWNYKHMVNISVRRQINSTNIRKRFNYFKSYYGEDALLKEYVICRTKEEHTIGKGIRAINGVNFDF